MKATQQEQSDPYLADLQASYNELAGLMVRSFIRVPGFPETFRNKLYESLGRLHKLTEPEDIEDFTKEMEELLNQALAEIEPSDKLREPERNLHEIFDSLSSTVNSISTTNSSAGADLEKQLHLLQDTVTSGGGQVNSKLAAIAGGIQKTVGSLSTELEQSREQVEQAGGRIRMLEQQLERVRSESMRDSLTGLNNRRAFNDFLEKVFAGYDPKKRWCAVMMDVDHFKRFNDTHGHLIGDALLFKIGENLMQSSPEDAFVARYGGEEFVMMIPSDTLVKALQIAEKIQRSIKSARWQYTVKDRRVSVFATMSAGVAAQRQTDNAETLLDRADRALYLAKEEGRDRTRSELDL